MVGIAQLAEHRIVVPGVVGSSPITHPIQWLRAGASAPARAAPFILGCSQVVRHGTLTPAFAGSSPAIPASSEISLTAPLPAGRAAESCARRKIFSLPHEAKGRLRGAPIWGKVHLVSCPLLSPARLKDSGPGARWGVARPSSSVGRATPF